MHWQIYSFRNRSFIQYWMKGIIITDKLLKFHQVLFFISTHIYFLPGFWFFSYLLSSSRETPLQLHNMLHPIPVGDEIWSPTAPNMLHHMPVGDEIWSPMAPSLSTVTVFILMSHSMVSVSFADGIAIVMVNWFVVFFCSAVLLLFMMDRTCPK